MADVAKTEVERARSSNTNGLSIISSLRTRTTVAKGLWGRVGSGGHCRRPKKGAKRAKYPTCNSVDVNHWRPSGGEVDRYGREVDEEYGTKDFERVVALRARTEAISRHLTDFLKNNDRFGKTIVFCVDQEHASEMRRPPRILRVIRTSPTDAQPVFDAIRCGAALAIFAPRTSGHLTSARAGSVFSSPGVAVSPS